MLKQLSDLVFLSVENNSITTLDGIQNVQSLLELYVGNNWISSSRDVHFLKVRRCRVAFSHRCRHAAFPHEPCFCQQELANLIILDLYGNPLVEKLENYRIFVIFHLPSLKALDGVAVVCCQKSPPNHNFLCMLRLRKVLLVFSRMQVSVRVQKACLRED